MLKVGVNYAWGGPEYDVRAMKNTMGDRIRDLRNSRRMSQEALGKELGVSGASISQWESGATPNIKPPNLLAFCQYFNVDVYWLVLGSESEDPLSGNRQRSR
jgi:transcriptional regulator with XRE-family HTH domain